MKRIKTTPNAEQPMMIQTVSRLNDIHDKLREIQCATSFLGTVSTDINEKYSNELMFGASVCFEMLDERFENIIGILETLTSEVKANETHTQTH